MTEAGGREGWRRRRRRREGGEGEDELFELFVDFCEGGVGFEG